MQLRSRSRLQFVLNCVQFEDGQFPSESVSKPRRRFVLESLSFAQGLSLPLLVFLNAVRSVGRD